MPSLFTDLAYAGWDALPAVAQAYVILAYTTISEHALAKVALQHVSQLPLADLSWLQQTFQSLGTRLSRYDVWEVAALSLLLGICVALLLQGLGKLLASAFSLRLSHVFGTIRAIPFVRTLLEKEKGKMRRQLLESRPAHLTQRLTALPAQGKDKQALLKEMAARAAGDVQVTDKQSRLSGAVYFLSEAHKQLLDEVYAANSFR